MLSKDTSYKVLLSNLSEAYRSANHLASSRQRIGHLMPLNGSQMALLSENEMEKLDAFRVRFCDTQDCMGNKLFRSLLKVELETAETMLDVINKMEKRRIISSVDEWKTIREVRNLFAHDYPDSDQKRAEVLNLAYEQTIPLLEILDLFTNYVDDHLKHLEP